MTGEAVASLAVEERQRLVAIGLSVLRDREEAEDVASQAVVTAFEWADRLRPESAAAWLGTVAYHAAIARAKQRTRAVPLEGGLPTSPLRWHISLRGPGRVPTWEELVDVAHQLRPGVPFVLAVPPRSLWMNVHPHVLHLWETADEPLLEEWRVNARGDAPT